MSAFTLVLSASAGFLAFWAGVVSLIGFMGWKPLAARYPAGRWPEGAGVTRSWQSARVGMASYSNVLHAVLAVEGLYLKPSRPFAFNHPPVFVPWTAVEEVRRGRLRGVQLRLRDGGGLVLYGRLGRMVEEALAAARPVPEATEASAFGEEAGRTRVRS